MTKFRGSIEDIIENLPDEVVLKTVDVARILGCHFNTVKKYAADGRLTRGPSNIGIVKDSFVKFLRGLVKED